MKAGQLRHLVTLEKYVESFSSVGTPVKTYHEFSKAWAEIRPLLSQEPFGEQEFHTEQTHRIKVRYQPGIEQTMRFKHGERYFEVIGAPSDWYERNIFLFFKVKEVFSHTDIHPEVK